MNVEFVSESVRNANYRAVAKRAAWRLKYSRLVQAIRTVKTVVRATNDAQARVILDSLRKTADDMMLDRWHITLDLRATAYEYADKVPEQEAA